MDVLTAADPTAVAVAADALLRREARLRALSAEIEHMRLIIAGARPTHEWRGTSSSAFALGLDALATTLQSADSALSASSMHTRRARLAVTDGG